jgi:ADP-ribose pyrophosphatase YjhB (NUDIX family)
MKDKLSNNEACPYCGRFTNRGITVGAIILRDDKILLIKCGTEPDKGKWGTPGGYVDRDENVEDTVKREVKEEVGLIVKHLELIRQYSKPDRHPKQTIDLVYAVETEGKPLVGDDASEFRWFLVNDIPKDLVFDHNQIIQDYLKKRD